MINGTWQKSSYSQGGAANCVEVRRDSTTVAVRDTQNRDLGSLGFPVEQWAALLREIKSGPL